MKWEIKNRQTRLYLVAAVILLVGLGSSILIYLSAQNDADNVLDFENSKMFVRDLELYGGKANVLVDELRTWLVGLWHGKSLAYTVACITIVISFGIFFIANHLSPKKNLGTATVYFDFLGRPTDNAANLLPSLPSIAPMKVSSPQCRPVFEF